MFSFEQMSQSLYQIVPHSNPSALSKSSSRDNEYSRYTGPEERERTEQKVKHIEESLYMCAWTEGDGTPLPMWHECCDALALFPPLFVGPTTRTHMWRGISTYTLAPQTPMRCYAMRCYEALKLFSHGIQEFFQWWCCVSQSVKKTNKSSSFFRVWPQL